jgi:L-fuculokinase
MSHLIPAIAIFDIGKTNKKAFLFNEVYKIVWEESTELAEILDEDGDSCEDLNALVSWIETIWRKMNNLSEFTIKALNFSAYGASMVFVDEHGHALTPLYNYLKPYPVELQDSFYSKNGGVETFAKKTASPVLGSLNSGMQPLRLKYEQPKVFERMKYYLHLPQYLSSLFTNQFYSEYTSIGCHTNLWDFDKNTYHYWLKNESLSQKTPVLKSANEILMDNKLVKIGTGLHDSSAALIPYLLKYKEPFVLISTGTWSISMNPFNTCPLTIEELKEDVLCFLTFEGKPIKAARLFLGREHDEEVEKLAKKYKIDKKTILKSELIENDAQSNINDYQTDYNKFMHSLVKRQLEALQHIIHNSPVKKVFVDGGFSKNTIFMRLLTKEHPEIEFYAAEVAQASALGAALIIHDQWNSQPIPKNLISLKRF